LAPDEQTGFTMALLRMLAFKPGDGSGSAKSSQSNQTPRAGGTSISSAAKAAAAPKVAITSAAATTVTPPDSSSESTVTSKSSDATYDSEDPDWQSWMKALPVRGLLQQLAFQTELQSWKEQGNSARASVIVGMPQLATKENVLRLQEALSKHLGKSVTILIEAGKANHSIAAVEAKIKQEKQEGAEESIANDDFVKTIQAEFGATVVPGSIRPIQ
jgi:DNA polymerase III subunit gamma/tau